MTTNTQPLDIEAFKKELAELLWKHNAYLGVDINGDTHGLRTNFVVGTNTPRRTETLIQGDSWLYPCDLASREELQANSDSAVVGAVL